MKKSLFTFAEPPQNSESNVFFQSDDHLDHFYKSIIFPLQEIEGTNPYHIRRPIGVLIYGAPGCGKSFLAKQFAFMLKRPYIIINKYDVLYKMKNGYCYDIDKLFDMASEFSATIIIENVETLLPSRDIKDNRAVQLDIANVLNLIKTCPEKNIIVIATTSRPQDVDPQIGYSGYLDELFYTPFPDQEMRLTIIKKNIEGRPQNNIDVNRLASECDGFSIDDILDIIDKAAVNSALLSCPITTDVLAEAITKKRLTIDPSVRKKYDDIHHRLESKKSPSKEIGFT